MLLVFLQRGDVGADGDIAAVAGAALVDLKPAPIGEARFVGTRSTGKVAAAPRAEAPRAIARRGERVAPRAGPPRLAALIAQALIFRVAQHQPVARIPQDKSFRDRLDRVAQSLVGGRRMLGFALALGDIEGDADEARRAGLLILDNVGALAKPYPAPVGRAHAKLDVDALAAPVGRRSRDRLQSLVVRVHKALQIGDSPVAGSLLEFEKIEHRGRPMDAAARQIPRPQAATSAIERQARSARASRALLANAPALASGVDRVQPRRRDNRARRSRRAERPSPAPCDARRRDEDRPAKRRPLSSKSATASAPRQIARRPVRSET